MLKFFSILNTVYNDAPQPWQIGFQDSAAPGFTGIVELHNTIFFYLVVICVGVFWVLGSIMYYFNTKNSPIVHKYLNHGTLIELIWTITPALILIAIAFPSFRLLYLLDEVISPTVTIKVVGFFLGGLKLYILNKIKDTISRVRENGKKNNIYYQTIFFKNRFSLNSRGFYYSPFPESRKAQEACWLFIIRIHILNVRIYRRKLKIFKYFYPLFIFGLQPLTESLINKLVMINLNLY